MVDHAGADYLGRRTDSGQLYCDSWVLVVYWVDRFEKCELGPIPEGGRRSFCPFMFRAFEFNHQNHRFFFQLQPVLLDVSHSSMFYYFPAK